VDDLRMLRDLGGELEHEPPPTLTRQRERLMRAFPGARTARRRRVGWMAAGLVAAATAAVVAVPTLLIARPDRPVAVEGPRPAEVTGALNVLVVGTDSQAGSPRFRNGARSDTMMIVHLPADRKKAEVVSLPRDSMVRVPACGGRPARRDMINSAYDAGGMPCAIKTVETLTDIRVDHYVEVEFAGFAEMVDALGGIEVKLARPVNDQGSKLKLPAGRSVVNGEQALAYVRLRNYGDGSDLARIGRQQVFMTAMLRKARSALTDPGKLRDFLAVASRSVKTDDALDLETMTGLATALRGSELDTVTVPVRPATGDPNRVEWKQPAADRLFERLR
jgi:LCP family protein required for cell wall assembly